MRIPTVRVKRGASFAVINQADLRSTDELWSEQAHDYVEPVPVAVNPHASAESEAAVRIFGKLMAKQLGMSAEQWAEVPSDERASLMAAEESKIDAAIAAGTGIIDAASAAIVEASQPAPAPAPAPAPVQGIGKRNWKGNG